VNLDQFERELRRQMDFLLERRTIRIVALVPIGDDEVLRDRLADSCAGITHPMIAVFEVKESPCTL
jgi:hypothetical protein